MRRLLLVLSAFTATAGSLPAQRADLDTHEWKVPWPNTRPRDPSVDLRGRVWFVGQVGNYIAYLDPESGKFSRFEIDSGTLPHSQIVDKQGMIWYSGNAAGMIGKLDPSTGKITRYRMPDPAVHDPHTMVFDRAGDIWFTAQQAGYVGHLDTRTGRINLLKVPTPRALPYGIWMDPKDRPWFAEFGSNRIAMIDPATMKIEEHVLPNPKSRPRRLTITSDGSIWFTDYSLGSLGHLEPASGAVEEWPSPSGGVTLPYGLTVDDRDRVWFAETGKQPNHLVAFDTRSKTFVANQPVGNAAANTIRYIIYRAPTHEIWYGSDLNMIGRVRVPATLAPLVP
jgi:virginiamycin B lyase